jgi:hypothetical protein
MRKTLYHSGSRQIVLLTALFVVVVSAAAMQALTSPGFGGDPPPEATPVTFTGGETVSWDDVDRLISEQKFEAASEAVAAIREQARGNGEASEWTRTLVEETKLRMALHGYETAVRFLRTEQWPEDAVSRAVLELYYANSLATYARVYSWEIRQRERVETSGELDLKKWDLEQILEEADSAFLAVWSAREQWGSESLGEFSRYIHQNNYPPRIRGTLRDAITYLWVELLANASFWSPAESNGVFQLDLAALINGDAEISSELDLADSAIHPLLKIGALLDDLEGWHNTNKRTEAALETRFERLRRLHAAFDTPEDRLTIRRHLEELQESSDRGLEWWSMGQSVLAEFIRLETDADALVRARAAAVAGRDRHPRSIGGQRCTHIVASIEAPSYSLAAMAVDGAGRRSFQISHRNFTELHFRAWRYDLRRFVESSEDYNIQPGHREAEEIMAGPSDAEWSIELPSTPDYRSHITYDMPQLDEPGAYLVVASMRADFANRGNQMVAENFILSDLVLIRRHVGNGYEITVRSGATGRATKGVDVSLYRFDYQRGHREIERKRTGDDGRVRFVHTHWKRDQYFLMAQRGDDLALDANRLYPYDEGERGVSSSALIYTDRSVYRPQQTLYWKAVAYRGGGEDIRYETVENASIQVSLIDANHEEVATATVTTNDFGSASGSFDIPAGRLLGRWQLRTSYGGQSWLRVEEYKRPTFEVEVADPETPLRLNREAALSGDVRYYFGLPVVTGSVKWRVTREPVYPRWWYWWYPSPSTQAQVVAAGETSLDDEGRFHLEFTPSADERLAKKGVTYRYRLGVDVTDEGGETRSTERVFRLGFVSVEARIVADLGFLTSKTAAAVRVLRTDLDGVPRAGSGDWRLVQLKQPEETLTPADQPRPSPPEGEDGYQTPGDRLRPRWDPGYDPEAVLAAWPEEREIAAGEIAHGEDGTAELELPGLAAGAYRLICTTEDEFGAEFETSKNLVHSARVAGDARLRKLLGCGRGDRAPVRVHGPESAGHGARDLPRRPAGRAAGDRCGTLRGRRLSDLGFRPRWLWRHPHTGPRSPADPSVGAGLRAVGRPPARSRLHLVPRQDATRHPGDLRGHGSGPRWRSGRQRRRRASRLHVRPEPRYLWSPQPAEPACALPEPHRHRSAVGQPRRCPAGVGSLEPARSARLSPSSRRQSGRSRRLRHRRPRPPRAFPGHEGRARGGIEDGNGGRRGADGRGGVGSARTGGQRAPGSRRSHRRRRGGA